MSVFAECMSMMARESNIRSQSEEGGKDLANINSELLASDL